MVDIHESSSRQVPSRVIPVPTTVSREAQDVLALPAQPIAFEWPEDLSDKQAVAQVIDQWVGDLEAVDGAIEQGAVMLFGTAAQDISGVTVEHATIDGVSVYIATPEGVTDEDPRTLMAVHGAWIYGTGEFSRFGAMHMAAAHGMRTWAIDYRMPPLHPYPAALDDCVSALSSMSEKYGSEHVAISGTSGGGNLGLALLLRARDEGLPMPAAAVINTPYADLTHAGDTYLTLDGVDVSYAPGTLDVVRQVYLDGQDPLDPYVSPVHGDFRGFPPVQLTTGTRDFLLSETCRVHRSMVHAGVDAELHCWEGAQHYMFMGVTPEDADRAATARRFIEKHVG